VREHEGSMIAGGGVKGRVLEVKDYMNIFRRSMVDDQIESMNSGVEQRGIREPEKNRKRRRGNSGLNWGRA